MNAIEKQITAVKRMEEAIRFVDLRQTISIINDFLIKSIVDIINITYIKICKKKTKTRTSRREIVLV